MISKAQFLKLLGIFGAVKNSSGAIDASVAHRRDTLANLLAVTDAVTGEFAQATDLPAIVSYVRDDGDTRSVGLPYFASGFAAQAQFTFTFGFTAGELNSNDNTLNIVGTVDIPDGIIDETNNEFDMPAWMFDDRPFPSANTIINVDLQLYVLAVSMDAGCVYDFDLEYWNGGSWIKVQTYQFNGLTANGSGNINSECRFVYNLDTLAKGSTGRLRIVQNNDNTTAGTFISGVGDIKVYYTAIDQTDIS